MLGNQRRSILLRVAALVLMAPFAPQAALAQVPAATVAAFDEADAGLNAAYQLARSVMPEASFLELRDTQRAWITYRDEFSAAHAQLVRGANDDATDPDAWPEYWQTRTSVTKARTTYLRGHAAAYDGTFDELPAWEGEWIDSFGGSLRIVQLSETELGFRIDVVRGPTGHTGEIYGTAQISDGTARYDVWVLDLEAEAGVLLERSGATITISSNGATNWFHGASASFDGTYVRIAALGSDRESLIANAKTIDDDVMPLEAYRAGELEKYLLMRNLRARPEHFLEAIVVGDEELVATVLGMPEAERWLAQRDEYGRTPLFHAVTLGHFPEPVVRASDVNVRALNGETALMLAAERPAVRVTQLLIEEGADIAAVDLLGQTALIHALRSSNSAKLETVALLLGAGSDPLRSDHQGRTAHDHALETGDRHVIDLVRDYHNLYVYVAHAKRLISASGLQVRDTLLYCPNGTRQAACGLVYAQDTLERTTVTIACVPLLASLHEHGDHQGVIMHDRDTYAKYETVLRAEGHLDRSVRLAIDDSGNRDGVLMLTNGATSWPLTPQGLTFADFCSA